MFSSLVTFESALLVIDIQTSLVNAIKDPASVVLAIDLLQKSAHELEVPIVATLQHPEKLGREVDLLRAPQALYFEKRSFNALSDTSIRRHIEAHRAKQWVVCGLEAHVCVLQSALELRRMGKEVVVAADACSSLNLYDYASAMSELRTSGVRVSSVQTIVYEWMKSSDHPSFSKILAWVKKQTSLQLHCGCSSQSSLKDCSQGGCGCS